ncbi:hypothetical protein Rhe02_42420 [Rhizocola hellebori]|uniref:VWFA domain-containing protein n=2 Tax=Rhizocola hellebori TaxID=1392758 RepID=A0A8J3VH63_9ACTN|nr:hypothetical protein Rhe02_42420 [Rhizocola hellebori]
MLTSACTDDGEKPISGSTLRLVAGSEQEAVLNTVVKPWCEAKKYDCRFTLKGSVDQARLLSAGSADYDAYWFASSVFLQLGDKGGALQDVKSMFLTPIVYAGWRSEMQRLDFVGRDNVSIADILTAVESGKTTVRVANPTQSNSGATVLFGFMNHFAGNGPGQPLTQQQLDSPAVEEGTQRFVRAMAETPPSTGTLMNECIATPARCKTFFTYEDLVIEKNHELVKAGREPLYAVYPRGSLAISDAPLGFRASGGEFDANRRKMLNELQAHLLGDAGAKSALLRLGRRPATSIGLSMDNPDLTVFNPEWGIQANLKEQGIQYPSATVIQAALDRYQTSYRKPVTVYYCLDSSGSMNENGGWDGIKAAATQVFDQDQARLNLLQTGPKDRTTVTLFNSTVTGGSPWTVDGADSAQMHGLTQKIQAHAAGGGTNMYQCLIGAATALRGLESGRKGLVIVMSDGQSDRAGRDRALADLKSLGVPVIALAFGDDADPDQLEEVAKATGGSFFRQDDLVAALRNAAGYR